MFFQAVLKEDKGLGIFRRLNFLVLRLALISYPASEGSTMLKNMTPQELQRIQAILAEAIEFMEADEATERFPVSTKSPERGRSQEKARSTESEAYIRKALADAPDLLDQALQLYRQLTYNDPDTASGLVSRASTARFQEVLAQALQDRESPTKPLCTESA